MTSLPVSGCGTARLCVAAVIGSDGYLAEVCAQARNGCPAFRILGQPDSATRETRDRIRAAVINSGLPWPARDITISLRPPSLTTYGTGLDLPIAIAVLTAAGVIPAGVSRTCVFAGELNLDGSLRPILGVLPALLAAARAGCTRAVIPSQNAAEAVMVAGLAVVPRGSLRRVVGWLGGEAVTGQPEMPAADTERPTAGALPEAGLAGAGIAPIVRLALEASAAGGHHLCLTGPPGPRIPALAAGLAALLPPLTPDEVTEVSAVYSVAGRFGSRHSVTTRPPFRAPHHTATTAAMAGGGQGIIRPGEAPLAHRGVLFLDEAPEFARSVLAVLRQPLQDDTVTIARSSRTVQFPAKFTLVAGMASCRCRGQAGCDCTPLQKRRYRGRLAGALGRWISIWQSASPPGIAAAVGGDEAGDQDAASARVAAARDLARRRFRGTPWRVNADIPGAELRRAWLPAAEALAPINRSVEIGEISAHAANQAVRLAWTLADLIGEARPGADQCGQALAFQLGVAQ